MSIGSALPAFANDDDQPVLNNSAKGLTNIPTVGESANPAYNESVTGTSTGDTKLYIIGAQDELTTSEGAANEQIRVSIPVAIHYVADSEGNLHGPSDNVVKFVNHTQTGAVHVSKIKVDGSEEADISLGNEVDGVNDRMSFTVQPVQGQSRTEGDVFVPYTKFDTDDYHDGNFYAAAAKDAYQSGTDIDLAGGETVYNTIYEGDGEVLGEGAIDELGWYSTTSTGHNKNEADLDPRHPKDWNIAQENGALGLNNLGGKIGGFKNIDSSTDYQAGVIHWTVRAGDRVSADTKDTTLTIRYNANTGKRNTAQGVVDTDTDLLKDQKAVILTYAEATPYIPADAENGTDAVEASDGGFTYNGDGKTDYLKSGDSVIAPKTTTGSDGSTTSWAFAGWSLNPNYSSAQDADNGGAILFVPDENFTVDDVVQNAKDYEGTAALFTGVTENKELKLGNGVLQLYAIYTPTLNQTA